AQVNAGRYDHSQADSACSIPVHRSHAKAQARGCFSGLGLDRSRALVAPRAINVPLACGAECAGRGEVVTVVPGSLSVDVSIDSVRDGSVGAACLVLVDDRGAFAVVPHPGHQVSQARPAGGCECVAGMSQVVACRSGRSMCGFGTVTGHPVTHQPGTSRSSLTAEGLSGPEDTRTKSPSNVLKVSG